MKTLSVFAALAFMAVGSLATGCSEKTESRPDDHIRDYARYFIEKARAGQLDSLTATFPGIVYADSIRHFVSDTLVINHCGAGEYDVTLAPGITIKIDYDDERGITVTQSHGLFAFPAEQAYIAEHTGLWSEGLDDGRRGQSLQEARKVGFFEYMDSIIDHRMSNIVTVGEFETKGNEWGEGTQTLTNNTPVALTGKEYSLIRDVVLYDNTTGERDVKELSGPGHAINADSTIVLTDVYSGSTGHDIVKGIKMKLTPEQLRAKFLTFTGNEYADFKKDLPKSPKKDVKTNKQSD